jgi:hypothetical protein
LSARLEIAVSCAQVFVVVQSAVSVAIREVTDASANVFFAVTAGNTDFVSEFSAVRMIICVRRGHKCTVIQQHHFFTVNHDVFDILADASDGVRGDFLVHVLLRIFATRVFLTAGVGLFLLRVYFCRSVALDQVTPAAVGENFIFVVYKFVHREECAGVVFSTRHFVYREG